MSTLKGKTLFITGASRGIGKAIALRAARDGANIVIAAKTTTPDPRIPGTIYSAAEEIESAGGKALPLVVDVRSETQVQAAVDTAAQHFGGLDILVNNASAISLTGTQETVIKRYDLMMDINVRGTFVCTQACLPHLERAINPHILSLSPPLNILPKWFAPHPAYTTSKFAMSMLTLGFAEEFRDVGIAANALWPRTLISTAALRLATTAENIDKGRSPDIMADAAYLILTQNSRAPGASGQFHIDEELLRSRGITDFDSYAIQQDITPELDLFVEE